MANGHCAESAGSTLNSPLHLQKCSVPWGAGRDWWAPGTVTGRSCRQLGRVGPEELVWLALFSELALLPAKSPASQYPRPGVCVGTFSAGLRVEPGCSSGAVHLVPAAGAGGSTGCSRTSPGSSLSWCLSAGWGRVHVSWSRGAVASPGTNGAPGALLMLPSSSIRHCLCLRVSVHVCVVSAGRWVFSR